MYMYVYMCVHLADQALIGHIASSFFLCVCIAGQSDVVPFDLRASFFHDDWIIFDL